MTDEHDTTSEAGPRPRRTWRVVRSLLVGRPTMVHLLVGLLCVGLGFAVVAQVRQTQDDVLSGMRQDDLVRLLDELTRRNDELTAEQEQLQRDLSDLRSSATSHDAAREAAELRATTRGILAGTLPVHGPGITLSIEDPGQDVSAQVLVTILEELRNAGAEAVSLSGRRLTATSWILDAPGGGVIVDGATVTPPYRWVAIGEPETMAVALNIPGGATAAVRNAGATPTLSEEDDVQITAVRQVEEAEVARPVPSGGGDG